MKSGLTGRFIGDVLTEYIDGNMWRLKQIEEPNFQLEINGIGTIRPDDNFVFDFASIPPPIRWFFPKTGAGKRCGYGYAAVIHDWLYSYPKINGKPVERRLVDRIFLLGMEIAMVNYVIRSLFFVAVRAGGGLYFGRPDKLNRLRGIAN